MVDEDSEMEEQQCTGDANCKCHRKDPPLVPMDIDIVEDDTAKASCKENNNKRMKEMRQNEEYREKERVSDAASKKQMRQNEGYREKERESDAASKKEMRQNEEYREKERVSDAASKKRIWDNMSPEEREEKNKKKRKRAKERRAEERAKKAKEPKGFIDNEKEWLWVDEKDKPWTPKLEKLTDKENKEGYKGKVARHYLGKMEVECGYCGALGFECEVKGTFIDLNNDGKRKKHFGNLCCCKGTVKGITDYQLPQELGWLYTSDSPMAVHFRENARTYNNGMAMSSITAQKGWRSRTPNKKMDAMLTSGGQLFRRVGSMLPNENGKQPKCVQTYFYGGDDATKYRILNTRKNISAIERIKYETVFKMLHEILTGADNKYIKSFLGVKDYVEKHLKDKVWDVKLSIHANESAESLVHAGRLNAPTVNEIAILLPSDDVITDKHKRYVTVNYKQKEDTDELQFIPDTHKAYDPLQYPLILPKGQDGWHDGLDHTCLQHINFQLMERKNEDGTFVVNPILRGRSLGQQYIVDQFAKSELSRLNWIEHHQKDLRAEVYSGAKDAMKSDRLGNVGKRVVLPSSFLGGDRYMHQQYLDSIALYQRFGHPHLFITMTCNPNWPEIQDNLKMEETALDQPALVSRVFNQKKRDLIRDLGSEMIFGRLLARTHSIEFQKRGFPHAHIIIWLKRDENQTKHLTLDEMDKIISAEIPDEFLKDDESENPLHKLVTEFMMHGPCDSTYSCRMGDGYCKYGYPKDYQSTTEMSEDAYPLYQRQAPDQGGNTFLKWRRNKRITYTNADVVPYNKYLLFKYNCHINVEYCHSINAIKYQFKYLYKGSDQASVTVESSPSAVEEEML